MFGGEISIQIHKRPESEILDCEPIVLDCIPVGWRIGFGEQMCDEIKAALDNAEDLRHYRVFDVDEKFGELRWYGFGLSGAKEEEIDHIVKKYIKLSHKTCVKCGRETNKLVNGKPLCEDCESGTDRQHVPDYVEPGMIPDTDMIPDIRERLADLSEDSIVFDNPSYDSAIVGVSSSGQVIYDYDLMLESLMLHDDMSMEEAMDFISYNTERSLSYLSDPQKPIIMYPLDI